MEIYRQLPPAAVQIVLVLFLSFLIGLEREERRATASSYTFGGVRTFPLIGLIGYSAALISGPQMLPVAIGFLVVAGFLLVSYWHKLSTAETAGVTTEMSGLTTFLVGALVCYDHLWIATALGVASLLLLDLKAALEKLARRIAPNEILTFAKFLFLSAVILPILPHTEYTQFHINPFKTWLVVVAISTVSYASYVLQKLTKGKGGVTLAALLGGAYSSTATTVVMARRAKIEQRPHLFAGSILMACGVMYVRVVILLALFSRQLMLLLYIPLLSVAGLAIGGGWLWSQIADANTQDVQRESEPKNPLDLVTAIAFAGLFLVMLVATQLAVLYLKKTGINVLAAIMGVADVDPFIMGLTQVAGTPETSFNLAAVAVAIAASSNNAAKGIYAFSLADRKTGMQALVMLLGLAALGLMPLFWLM
jgi:uncharacterized membrane protein (DUF4010 family)